MQWKEIENYPEYEISDEGILRSKDREIWANWLGQGYSKRLFKGKILKPNISVWGYFYTNISNQTYGEKPVVYHKLVAKYFVEGGAEGLIVNHIDGNKQNNRAENLEWVSQRDNVMHAIELGLRQKMPFGKDSPACKGVIEVLTLDGEVIDSFAGERECKEKGYQPPNVRAVIKGKNKTHRGLKFRYKIEESVDTEIDSAYTKT